MAFNNLESQMHKVVDAASYLLLLFDFQNEYWNHLNPETKQAALELEASIQKVYPMFKVIKRID